MASSYSSDLKLELMVTGENAGTWGDKTNTNLNLVQQAIAGFEQVTLSSGSTTALVMSDGALSNARNLVIKFATITAGASTICTIPDSIEKFYIFDVTGVTNPSNLTIKTASGTGFSPDAQKIYAAYSDGTNLNEVSLDTLGGTIGTAQVADSAISTAKIADDAVTSAKIADDAVVAAAIADDAVGTAAIADDAVGADQLANTSVTPGSYTASSITVDAQGRLTAASSGAGAANMEVVLFQQGPTSGTYTSGPAASKFQAYLGAAGGGGGGGGSRSPGGPGGAGGFGFYSGSVQSSTGYSYSVGSGGTGGSFSTGGGGTGNTGQSSNITNLATANGGGGGGGGGPGGPGQIFPPGNTGNAGSAPGANTTSLNRAILFGMSPGVGTGGPGGGAGQNPGNGGAGNTGNAGAIAIFDNG